MTSLPFLVLGERPHDVPLPAVTSADKRDLVELVQQQNTSESGFRVYRIDSASFDRLLDWSLTVEPLTGARARAELSDQSQCLRGSLPWPPGADNGVPQRFLNVTLSGQCEIVGEELLLDLCTLRIGAVQVPEWAARWLGQAVAQWVNRDPANAEMLTGVVAVRADRQGVDVVLSDDGLRRRRVAHLMRRLGDQPDVAPEVRIQLAAMARIVREADRTDPLFELAVRSALQLARDRSRSRDPIRENRAAILRLGIALGHVGLEMYVGDVLERDTAAMVLQLLRQSRLRDRADWSRHFWVSAAVTLLAGDRISDVVGLLKEELDAGPSGSGFSFSDLMADRAGTEFAQAATRDAPSARAIEQWVLADDTDLQWLMPAADDLPEGLTDTDMDARFDGVGGARFRQMLDEIQQRLDGLPWRR